LQEAKNGSGFRILTETITSPTLAAQLNDVLKKFPQAKWHQYQPVNRDAELEASQTAFGNAFATQYKFDEAEIIVSLDSDLLFAHPASLKFTRDFTNGRRVSAGRKTMNRLYVVESTPTITGAMADHRFPVAASEVEFFAWQLGSKLLGENAQEKQNGFSKWVSAIARDLELHRGKSIVIAGENQSPAVYMLAHLLNEKLGNIGKTVFYTQSAEARPEKHLASISDLASDMQNRKVDLLLILGGNPVFNAPADLEFGKILEKVPTRIHLGASRNETSAICQWHVAESHFLESWSDVRAFDGTTSIIQPLIEPLYKTFSAHEILDAIFHAEPRSSYEIVREHWQKNGAWTDFEKSWRKALHDGIVEGTAFKPKTAESKIKIQELAINTSYNEADGVIELNFRPDPSIWDGRFANNGWLQEAGKPISKLTWDNAVLVSQSLAKKLKSENGDVVEVKRDGKKIRGPIWISPGQPNNSVTLHFGYGRREIGRVGERTGFDVYPLRTSKDFWSASEIKLRKTGEKYPLASTQLHQSIQGRDVLRATTLAKFLQNPAVEKMPQKTPAKYETLYDPNEFPKTDYAWGMSIDLNTCIGCNACVIGCQSENNIPIVGKSQVMNSREMHWIRIDGYFSGRAENPEINHQPVPCMHCENAPCELVCPVAATMHDSEGLNVQVYNRCVGTRYCSNNCPYKVRRFNFLQYADLKTESLKLMRNPEVTVRWRGVMEKCTYCIQRISAARIASEKENRAIRDGEIKTACQQACPTDAIVFGNISDPQSAVSKLKSQPLDYGMLAELNTRPRTSYLARLRNPNPELAPEENIHG
jgi:molybdopterin-containing oxidoreductase family iron-sulfur binding subunit